MKFFEHVGNIDAPNAAYLKQAEQLRANPGMWGLIREDEGTRWVAKHITAGALAAFRPKGAYQGKSVQDRATKRFTIYAKYLGEPDVEEVDE